MDKIKQIRRKPVKCNYEGCYDTPNGICCDVGCQRGSNIIVNRKKRNKWTR